MRIETIELLRCPVRHDNTPLITVAHRREDNHLLDATLGCPICGAEYALRDGALFLSPAPSSSRSADDALGDDSESHTPLAERTAALLHLTEPGARVLLCGQYGLAARAVATATHTSVVAINARPADAARVDTLYADVHLAIPFSSDSVQAIAVDSEHAHWLAEAVRVVRVGGRILSDVNAPVPDGCRELARDAAEWLAEVESAVSRPIELRRRDATSS